MARYRFTQDYVSSYGIGQAGDVVDLDEEQAENINRDAPGTLEPAKGSSTERAVAEPPADRMVRAAPNRAFPDGSPESRVAPVGEEAEKEKDEEEEKPKAKPARGTDDREGGASDQGPITRADHKAVKNKGD